jgi:hypothetical protein
MRTHVEFKSDAFPPEKGEEARVNPGRWGKRLAEYLRSHLTTSGLACGEPFPKDWGWCLPIENPGFSLWVGCGNYEEHAEGFLCFIEPSKPIIRKLLMKIDTRKRVAEVADAIDKALSSNSRVREVRWWTESEVSR